ncbi:MAG TPA: hypothetical protein VJR29_02110 [bacterium]|nr:hypothetical protein [bacterium]
MFWGFKRGLALLTLAGLLIGTSLADAAQVALFMNGTYVDIDDQGELCEAEANNLQITIESFGGHSIVSFTGITDADFTAALAGSQVLVIPELEGSGSLDADLSAEAIAVISDFVDQGGSILVFETDALDLLNTLFGFSLAEGDSDTASKTAEAAGTIFADGPATIPANNGTGGILVSSFPTGAINVYNYNDGADDNSLLAILPFGSGEAIFFGWDWYGSIPPGGPGDDCEGGLDGGWVSLLSTVLETSTPPTPSPTPSPTAEPDADGDGVPDADDNCPIDANADQGDNDQDGVGDECDPTPAGFELGGGGCSLQTHF